MQVVEKNLPSALFHELTIDEQVSISGGGTQNNADGGDGGNAIANSSATATDGGFAVSLAIAIGGNGGSGGEILNTPFP